MKPVRMGILGCAAVAEYAVMDVLPHVPELVVSAIASRDRLKAEGFAKRHRIDAVRTYDELIADDEVEAIYIPLPNSMHCEWTVRALEAGKAVLCEKPLALNAREAARMLEVARRTGTSLVEAFHWRYHPMCDRISAVVRSGVLGDLRQIAVSFLLPQTMVPDSNIRWCYDLGGGALMDTGAYCVNFLRFLLGEPERIIAAVATVSKPQVDGRMQAELMFARGCIGRIDASQISDVAEVICTAELTGSNGVLRVKQPFVPQWGGALEIAVDGKLTHETVDPTPTYVFQARAFADHVRNGRAIRTSGSDAVANMQVIDDIYRAAGLSARGEYTQDQ